ncbi:exo-rhamnogalacturonase b [Colletotrichum plurivorum]|uniref:Exo-rhamnogalacturonase b n=1 Tax=Colletotrichum plurivorum TaxID=2175906 RepID=A0A8H6NGU6_9PEZI|nr:exo-rhamnogalacturonase b [Colletotrichum plurivorum]
MFIEDPLTTSARARLQLKRLWNLRMGGGAVLERTEYCANSVLNLKWKEDVPERLLATAFTEPANSGIQGDTYLRAKCRESPLLSRRSLSIVLAIMGQCDGQVRAVGDQTTSHKRSEAARLLSLCLVWLTKVAGFASRPGQRLKQMIFQQQSASLNNRAPDHDEPPLMTSDMSFGSHTIRTMSRAALGIPPFQVLEVVVTTQYPGFIRLHCKSVERPGLLGVDVSLADGTAAAECRCPYAENPRAFECTATLCSGNNAARDC